MSERKTKYVTLGTLCFALFMVMLDSTVVNLALPTIQDKLGASLTGLQWIIDAYILLLASLLFLCCGLLVYLFCQLMGSLREFFHALFDPL